MMKKIYAVLVGLLPFLVLGQDYYGPKTPNTKFLKSPEPQTIQVSGLESESNDITTFGAPTASSQEVGVLEGKLTVSSAGAANYSIPIAVPPGITSTIPQVSLSYNSQGGNNQAGYGWGISGVSTITRIPSTKFHDGTIDPVDYDLLDRFALDGQRLMLKSGTYGRDGAVYETENYSTLRITSIGNSPFGSGTGYDYGPSSFKVEYPDGSFAIYGGSISSYSRNEWSITYWQSSLGVKINYEYINDAVNNTLYISKISYGSLNGSAQINEINFQYTLRARPEQAYIGGQLSVTNSILEAIRVKGNGVGYRNYLLEYDTTSLKYQRLIKVTEWNGNNTTNLNPTVFTYSNTTDAITYSSATTAITEFSNLSVDNCKIVSGEFSGDGQMDFIMYGTYGSLNKNKYLVYSDLKNPSGPVVWQHDSGLFEEIIPVNYLGGDTSIGYKLMPTQGWAVVSKSGNTETFTVYAQTSTGIVTQLSYNYSDTTVPNEKKYYGGDFNGDGLTDIISLTTTYGNATFINLDPRNLTHIVSTVALGSLATNDKVMVGDFDGDGRSDLFIFRNNYVRVYGLNPVNQQLVLLTEIFGDSAINVSYNPLMGDYNGDGKIDFIFPKGTSYEEYRKYTSTGKSFIKTIESYTALPYASNNSLNTYHYIPTDYNNDGKSDLLLVTCSGALGSNGIANVKCYLNKDGKFYYTSGNYTVASTGNLAGLDLYGIPVFLNPNKKNPKIEIAVIRNNKIHYFQSSKDFSKEKLLKNVMNGNGISETITYSPLLNTCTTSSGCLSTYLDNPLQLNYPYFDIVANPAQSLVSKLERQSNDTYQQQQYRYFGAVTNLDGLGYLGFKSTTKTNWYTDTSQVITNLTKFDIDKRGAVKEDYMISGFAGPSLETISVYISKTVNTLDAQLLANNVYKTKTTKVVTENGLESTSNTVTNTYDDYNNLLTTSTSAGAVSLGRFTSHKSQASTFEYDNYPTGTPYIIGRLNKKTTNATQGLLGASLASEELYTYTNGLLTQIKKKGNQTDYITEDNSYDAFGNITQKTVSATGFAPRVTKYEYDPSGRFLTKSTDVEGLSKTYTTNPATGELINSTDTKGIVSSFLYDTWGKEITATDYLGKTKTTTYTILQLGTAEINVVGQDGNASYTRVDDLGREIIKGSKNIDATWSYVLTNYDAYGRVVAVSEPYNTLTSPSTQLTATEYDGYGRISKITSYTGKVTTYTYSGRTTTVNDGIQTVSTVKNAVGDITSKTDAGGTISYVYYPNGIIKTATYSGSVTSVEIDGWGRKKKLTDPSAGVYDYEYNPFGQITKETTPKGNTVYTYLNNGKLIDKSCNEAAYGGSTSYYYYPDGLIMSTSWFDASGNFQDKYYSYDNYKRLAEYEENTANTHFVKTYTYDAFGRVETEKLLAGYNGQTSVKNLKYTYKNGALWQIYDADTETVVYKTTYVNARGQVTKAQYGNLVNIDNTYDAYGFPQQILHTKKALPADINIIGYNYVFDAQRRNLTSRNDMVVTRNESFQYDNLDRLTQFTNTRGEQETQVYDNRGRITSNNQGAYVYDSAKVYQHKSLDMSTEGSAYYTNRQGIFDGTMENKNGWDESAVYDSSKAHSGNYSLQLSSSRFLAVTSIKIPVDNAAATSYTVSGFLTSVSNSAKVYLIQEKASGLTVESVISLGVPASPDAWMSFSQSFTIASDVKKLSLRVEKLSGSDVWVDDLKITKTADITAGRQLDITYNMFKAPVKITEAGVDKIDIMYYGQESRSEMYYGSMDTDIMKRPYRKFYSGDGTFEIKHNIVDNTIEFITYVGGDGYTAPLVWRKQETNEDYLYLHRDYQGSITAISDQEGTVIERRQFDAWGNVVLVLDADGNVLSGLTVLDRGYTGHEHLQSVGLINMNGRLYDAKLHRFLQPDNNIQLPYDTQNYNRYAYVLNNPLKYTDPSGETWLEDNWKTIVTIGVAVVVTVVVTAALIASGGLAAPVIAMYAGAAGGFAGGFTGTMLNGGSVEDALINGAIGGFIGGFSGYLGGWAAGFAPSGILPGAAFGGASNYVIGGFSNLLTGKDFNDGWLLNTVVGTFAGGGAGYASSLKNSKNILTGAVPKPKPNAIEIFNNQVEGFHSMSIPAENPIIPMGGEATNIADNAINLDAPSSVLKQNGNYSVYQGLDADGVAYVGITGRDPQVRFGEHYSSFGTGKELLDYRVIEGATNLSKIEARILEQNLINQFGLQKNGGVLLNKINSISPKKWTLYGITP